MSVKPTDSLYVIPDHFGDSLSTLAGKPTTAEEKKAVASISTVCQEVIQKAGYNVLLSEADMEKRVALLRQLRERCKPALESIQGKIDTSRKSDPKIPVLSKLPFFKDMRVPVSQVTGMATTFNRNGLAWAAGKLEAEQNKLQTQKALLAKDVEDIKSRGLECTVKLVPLSNQQLKESMPDLKIIDFGIAEGYDVVNYGMMFGVLCGMLDIQPDSDLLDGRVEAFGNKQGVVPSNIEGKDIDLAKLMATSRFDEMARALENHCKSSHFRMKSGVAYFVPGEMSDQKVQVRADEGTITVTLEAKMPLIHLENAETFAHITARSETVFGSGKTTYTFYGIQPTAAINLAHCEKIQRVFKDKPAINAPEGA